MATDLSLRRLRELLQLAWGSCEAAEEAVHNILNRRKSDLRLDQWWKDNWELMANALGYSYKAQQQVSNAAATCEQYFPGDAVQLSSARDSLMQRLKGITASHHAVRGTNPGTDWFEEQYGQWCSLIFSLSEVEIAVRSLLTSEILRPESLPDEGNSIAVADEGDASGNLPLGFLGGAALADALGIHATRRHAFFRQLERQRMSLGDDCWHEVRDPRPNSPRFLYMADSPKLRKLAADYKNPKPA